MPHLSRSRSLLSAVVTIVLVVVLTAALLLILIESAHARPIPQAKTYLMARAGYVLPWHVVRCESGGNWRAVNHRNPRRPAGAYQIITSTWRAYGGGRFAATADRASPRQQNIIALRVLRGQGRRAWECWR